MKRLFVIAALLGVAALASAPAVAETSGSDDDNTAHCTVTFTQYFEPGVGLAPASGAQSSRGEVGSINCTGRLSGANITGPGTIGNEGRLHNSNCLVDHTTGRYFGTLPTDRGPLRIEGHYEVFRTGITFEIRTRQPGARGAGWGFAVPTKGDCVVNPMTEALILITIDFRGEETLVPTCDLNLGVVQVGCRSRS